MVFKRWTKRFRKRKGIPISKTPVSFPYVMVKESILSEGEKEKIEQLLIKYGNTPEDAKQMIKKTYDYIKKATEMFTSKKTRLNHVRFDEVRNNRTI